MPSQVSPTSDVILYFLAMCVFWKYVFLTVYR